MNHEATTCLDAWRVVHRLLDTAEPGSLLHKNILAPHDQTESSGLPAQCLSGARCIELIASLARSSSTGDDGISPVLPLLHASVEGGR